MADTEELMGTCQHEGCGATFVPEHVENYGHMDDRLVCCPEHRALRQIRKALYQIECDEVNAAKCREIDPETGKVRGHRTMPHGRNLPWPGPDHCNRCGTYDLEEV